jgi:cytochrome c oxidase assembly protein subunit 15
MERTGSRTLAIGFGTTVAMWAAGYVCRLPFVMAPSALVLALVVACQLGGGFVAGRHGGSWRAGILPALLSSVLNLLVLGSLLSGDRPNTVVPSALLFLPGFLLLSVALGAAGAWLGARQPSSAAVDWTAVLVRVAAVATFFLLIVGGLVTSNDAGLAVVDWPNSYGYNMFLYPLGRMTGGIYLEHAHRLFGSLVGLTTLVLAMQLLRVEPRVWVRRLGLAALALVILQGVLGGLRVTGRLTLSQETEPRIALAVVHGITAQLFFATLVALAVFTSRTWKDMSTPPLARAPVSRMLARSLVVVVLLQLVLGALVRHLSVALHPHLAGGVIVGIVAVIAGVKAAGSGPAILRRPGWTLVFVTIVQILLGVGAFVTTRLIERAQPGSLDVLFTTSHQAVGAFVLACSVVLLLRNERLAWATPS